MNRKPNYEQTEELVKIYHSCNSRIVAPLVRFLFNYYDREEIEKWMTYKASEIDYLMDKEQHYYIIEYNRSTKKIEVFDLLKMRIEREI